jgi:hypothetical protein
MMDCLFLITKPQRRHTDASRLAGTWRPVVTHHHTIRLFGTFRHGGGRSLNRLANPNTWLMSNMIADLDDKFDSDE